MGCLILCQRLVRLGLPLLSILFIAAERRSALEDSQIVAMTSSSSIYMRALNALRIIIITTIIIIQVKSIAFLPSVVLKIPIELHSHYASISAITFISRYSIHCISLAVETINYLYGQSKCSQIGQRPNFER